MVNSGLIYEFGPFLLDTGAHRLLRENAPVSLAPKSFDLLRLLAENQGLALSKSELLEALWPNTQVEEGSLTFQVSVLRKALGPEAASWIETVPRYGYRFSTPVAVHHRGENLPVSVAAENSPQRGRKRYVAGMALVLVALTVAFGIWITIHGRTDVVASDLNPSRNRGFVSRAVPLTAFRGLEMDPAVSPDGEYAAFVWNGPKQDNFDIYVVEIRSGTLQRISSDPAPDLSPAWSPDGRSIAFLRRVEDDRAALLVIPSAGGPEHRIGETRNARLRAILRQPTGALSLAWSPDGRWVAASHHDLGELHESIYLFSLTGEKRRITAPPEDSFGDHMPAFASDGRNLAFCRLAGYSTSDLYLLPLDQHLEAEGDLRRLTNHKRWSINPVWMTDKRKEILYTFGENVYTPREVRIARTAGKAAPERSLRIDDELWQISLGRHLVYSKRREETDIWRGEIARPGEPPRVAERFNSSTAKDGKARYSPDGKKISFVSSRSGSPEVWISNADGSEPVRITSFGGPLLGTPAWSPDGQRLVFHARPEGQADLFVIPAVGGSPRRLTANSSDDLHATYSRDGRWIYFNSVRTGQPQVFRIPSAGGDAVQITTGGGLRPMESLDGETLFYASADSKAIRQMPVTGGVDTAVVTSVCVDVGFEPTIAGLAYAARVPGSTVGSCEFRLLALGTGVSRPLSRTVTPPAAAVISISPDGRYFLFDQAEEPGMDLMLIRQFWLQ